MKKSATLVKIKNFIYVPLQKVGSRIRLFSDYLTTTTIAEYEEANNDIHKVTLWERFKANTIDNITLSLMFGILITTMLWALFDYKLSVKTIFGFAIAYGLLRHCLKRIFNKEI